jgi:hypothetical protein
MNAFYTANWPDQMTIDSTWECNLQREEGKIGVRFLTYYDGAEHDFHKVICRFIANKLLAKQLKRRTIAETSTLFLFESLVRLWEEETRKSLPSNTSWRIFSSFVFKNDAKTLGISLALSNKSLKLLKRNSKATRLKYRPHSSILGAKLPGGIPWIRLSSGARVSSKCMYS